MSAEQFLLLATGVHLGFQAVVTVLVYPALVNLAPDDWVRGHAAHSHRMIIMVIPVYATLFTALGWALSTVSRSPALIVTTGAILFVGVTTALVAAPIHHRLSTGGPTQKLLCDLRRADTFRLIGAAFACGAAILI